MLEADPPSIPNPALDRDAVVERAIETAGEWPSRHAPLLAQHEAPPYCIANATGRAPIVFTCDHASHAVPESLGNLGLSSGDLRRHIGWDIGAAEVTCRLAERFDAPAILSGYSRLVIDCNRKLGSETSVLEVSDGTVIPGNLGLAPVEIARRAEALFVPYHEAISSVLQRISRGGSTPIFAAIHSFTPRLNGSFRPWHFGVLWDEDPRVARPLIEALRASPGLAVGDNEPYSARDHFDFSQEFHASSAGIPSALVEIRDDLISDRDGIEFYANVLGNAMAVVVASLRSSLEGR